MFSKNNSISIRQLQALLILDTFGTGIAILPREAAEFAGPGGYICVIIGTLLAMLYVFVISTLAKRFSGLSFVDFTAKLFTRRVGNGICTLFVVKILVQTALELRLFSVITRQTILYDTPYAFTSAVLLVIAAYAAGKGYETRARLGEILIFIVFVPLLIAFAVSSFQVDYTNLLPMFNTTPRNLISGGYRISLSFTAFEFCLMAFFYLNKTEKAVKGMLTAVGISGALMTIITVITTARFGKDITWQTWPVIEMMDSVNLPGSFVERQGALIMSFWIVSVFAIVSAGLFFSSLLLKGVIRRGSQSAYIILALAIVFILSQTPLTAEQTTSYMDMLYYSGGCLFLIILPVLMLITSLIGRKTHEKQ